MREQRPCEFCATLFTPEQDNQKYCSRNHARVARKKRSRGIEPVIWRPEETLCLWCSAPFMPSSPDILYCSREHHMVHAVCESKNAYPDEAAAREGARGLNGWGFRLEMTVYPCSERPHWHIRNETKRQIKAALGMGHAPSEGTAED